MLTKHQKRIIETTLVYLALAIGVAISMFPILWMVSTSLKTQADYFAFPPVWIPSELDFSHYIYLFTKTDGAVAFKNSFILGFSSMVAVLVFSIPMAYAIVRFRVGGKQLPNAVLILRMAHPIALVLPLFLLYRQFNLLDTHIGLIMVYTVVFLPFAIWILIGFFQDFPFEIEEAALIDGCSRLRALVQVIIPILTPGISVVGLFAFIFAWNEFLFTIVLSKSKTKTLMVMTNAFIQSPTDTAWGEAASLVVIGIIPCVCVAIFLQRYLAKGLTLGGVKG